MLRPGSYTGWHRRATLPVRSPGTSYLVTTAALTALAGALVVPQLVVSNASAEPTGRVDPTPRATGIPAAPAPAPAAATPAAAAATPTPAARPTDAPASTAAPSAAEAAEAAKAAQAAQAAKAARAERADRAERAARSAERPTWAAPVRGARLTADFGDSGSRWSNDHTGQDFAAPTGTPVHAVGAGTVVSAGNAGAYGKSVVLQHDDGTHTSYSHMSSIAVEGGRVAAGAVIGEVGSTGNSTGPHLHLEVRPDGGDPVAPLPWLEQRGVRF